MKEYLTNFNMKSEIIRNLDKNLRRTIMGSFKGTWIKDVRELSYPNLNRVRLGTSFPVAGLFLDMHHYILGAANERILN
jgi:hypothetical protein